MTIGHLHDGVILLLCANQWFCYLSLTGAFKFKYEKKNEKNSGRNSKMTPSCKWPIVIWNEFDGLAYASIWSLTGWPSELVIRKSLVILFV